MSIEFASAISTLFAELQVKDPAASTGDLFEDWVSVPGVGSITLPTNQANPNTQVTLQGTKQTGQFAERGQIQIPLSTLLPHSAVHEFFRAAAGTGKVINIQAVTKGEVLGEVAGAYGTTANGRKATIVGDKKDEVLSLLEPGLYFEQRTYKPSTGTAAISSAGAVTYTGTVPTAAQAPVGAYLKIGGKAYRITTAGGTEVDHAASVNAAAYEIVNVCQVIQATPDDSGNAWASFMFDPPAVGALTGADLKLHLPSLTYANIACTVSGYDDGDLQSQAAMTGSITLIPSRKLGAPAASIY